MHREHETRNARNESGDILVIEPAKCPAALSHFGASVASSRRLCLSNAIDSRPPASRFPLSYFPFGAPALPYKLKHKHKHHRTSTVVLRLPGTSRHRLSSARVSSPLRLPSHTSPSSPHLSSPPSLSPLPHPPTNLTPTPHEINSCLRRQHPPVLTRAKAIHYGHVYL